MKERLNNKSETQLSPTNEKETKKFKIELPCQVGDIVYCLYQFPQEETKIIELEIDTFEIHKSYILIKGYIGEHCFTYLVSEIGKTVFLTKEEAEQALKGGAE